MADISSWSADEKENLFLDDLNLSNEQGAYIAKIMAAVKAVCTDFETRIAALEAEDDTEPSSDDTEPSTEPADGEGGE